jgi:hypothetical protein
MIPLKIKRLNHNHSFDKFNLKIIIGSEITEVKF